MNKNTTSPYCKNMNMHTFRIQGDLSATVTLHDNSYRLPLEALFSMAARINNKRSFLFVSKILGKHIPVNPYTPLLGGAALSLLLTRTFDSGQQDMLEALLAQTIKGLANPLEAEDAYHSIMNSSIRLPFPAVFIGFAETATALGHSMYNVFDGDCSYIHTTREQIPSLRPFIQFDEEHSHAVSHRCYAVNQAFFAGEETIVLVDDEITTGKTALNIIEELQGKFPRKHYVVASLLDWRSAEDEQRYADLESRLGIAITSLSLVKGTVEVTGRPIPIASNDELSSNESAPEVKSIYLHDIFERAGGMIRSPGDSLDEAPYLAGTGRFGMDRNDNLKTDSSVREAGKIMRTLRTGGRTLCLGTGEFMYLPMRIAAEMGDQVFYHSTTRSPIYCVQSEEYAVKNGASFPSPEDSDIINYVYNIIPGEYDDLFLFLERDARRGAIEPMLDVFRKKGFRQINVVICGPRVH